MTKCGAMPAVRAIAPYAGFALFVVAAAPGFVTRYFWRKPGGKSDWPYWAESKTDHAQG